MKPSDFTLQAESGELFGIFPNYPSAHRWLVRQGLEWEPFKIVSLGSVISRHSFYVESPRPLEELRRPSLVKQ